MCCDCAVTVLSLSLCLARSLACGRAVNVIRPLFLWVVGAGVWVGSTEVLCCPDIPELTAAKGPLTTQISPVLPGWFVVWWRPSTSYVLARSPPVAPAPPYLSLSLSRSPRRPPAALVSPCSYFVYQAQAHDKGEAGNADEEQLEDLADQADAFDSELKHVAS